MANRYGAIGHLDVLETQAHKVNLYKSYIVYSIWLRYALIQQSRGDSKNNNNNNMRSFFIFTYLNVVLKL